ncbi:MAG: FAD-dependent thymidylate synthase [Anaerolineales bacterium]|nr:FAD-dependent thymidylate synthase [Anaerolineales bacterium]
MGDRSRRIYLLDPKQLSPETIAVAFAKTSRSPQTFEQIAAELTDADSAAFHEKWVVGYGHASVAEHAVLHVAFENVSRLAVEAIEHSRLASYTEKSTRYQVWSIDGFHVPQEVSGTRFEAAFRQACANLMEAYVDSLQVVKPVVRALYPRSPGEGEDRWDGRIRSRYVDACRFLLPAAVFANVGMTVNARVLENALRRMLAHPLQEVRALAAELKQACLAEVPTLLKYAVPGEVASGVPQLRPALPPAFAASEGVMLFDSDPSGESRVLAAGLYPSAGADFRGEINQVQALEPRARRDLAEALLGGRGPHDAAPRALELAGLTVEVTTDQGSFFELKRHRMMTQVPQPLTARLGYAVPRLIQDSGFGERYRAAMTAAGEAFEELAAWNPDVASYVVPNGYYRRVVLSMNLREAFHFCELRSAENAHFSIRCIALELADRIRSAYPILGSYLRTPDTPVHSLRQQVFVPA